MATLNRSGQVFANDQFAGIIAEFKDEDGVEFYSFIYDANYIADKGSPIGHHYPLQEAPFEYKTFPPFFQNLVSEGWVKTFQARKANLDKKDDFGLLLANGGDIIGAISVFSIDKKKAT